MFIGWLILVVGSAGAVGRHGNGEGKLFRREESEADKWWMPFGNESESEDEGYPVEIEAQQQSWMLSERLARAAEALPYSHVRDLLSSLRICGACDGFRAFGKSHVGGGYLLCTDGLEGEAAPLGAYTLGVSDHGTWAQDVAEELGVKVHQLDCRKSPKSVCDHERCRFHPKCVGPATGLDAVPGHEADMWSLAQALERTEEAPMPSGSLLAMTDVGGSEWSLYAAEPAETLQKFSQIIVKFHDLQHAERHADYLSALERILGTGFQVVHLFHVEDACSFQAGGWGLPCTLGVLFARTDERPDGCVNGEA